MSIPLTAAQLAKHPEFLHGLQSDLIPTQQGLVSVAADRGGPFQIAYEVHGAGERRMVLIMGLGSLKSAWYRQTEDFGHKRSEDYSVLVLDNRGMGASSKPLMRYSTSEMARDVLEVLQYLTWTSKPRSIHIVGISMGGMIAQELALLIEPPTIIGSLTLVSTAARIVNTVGYLQNLRNRINLFIPKSIDRQIANTKHMIYTPEFLSAPDDIECKVQPFPTAGDRFAAMELWKRSQPGLFSRTGFMCQLLAAGYHHKSPQQLKQLADRIGRDRICVMHGTKDQMITFPHGRTLAEELSKGVGEDPKPRVVFWEGQGHVIPIEKRSQFLQLLEEVMDAAQQATSIEH